MKLIALITGAASGFGYAAGARRVLTAEGVEASEASPERPSSTGYRIAPIRK